MDISELQGRWVLESVNGTGVAVTRGEIFIQISANTVIGFDGCNNFGAGLGQLSLAQKGQRGCAPDTPPPALDLAIQIRNLSRAEVRDDKLILPLSDGKGEAQFRRSR